jgi:hypothetical protein
MLRNNISFDVCRQASSRKNKKMNDSRWCKYRAIGSRVALVRITCFDT